jgi:hypothetical protein
MDTTMQQAVSENITTTQEEADPTTTNSEDAAGNNNNNNGTEEEQEVVGVVPTYDQQFPSLGGGGTLNTAPPIGRWNKKPPLLSSIITQGTRIFVSTVSYVHF